MLPVDERLTYDQAAAMLECHVSNIPKLIRKGHLPRHRDPGRRRGYLLRADVEALIEARVQVEHAASPRIRRRLPIDRRPDAEHDWLAPTEVARLTGLTHQGILARIRRGRLPATRDHGRWWVRRDHLEQVEASKLAAQTRAP